MAHPSPCQRQQRFDKGHLHGINAAPWAAELQLGMALSQGEGAGRCARGHADQGAALSPGQHVANAALSGAPGERDKFGDAPVLLGALDAEPCCRQSRVEPTHSHPCSSPGHPPCNTGPIPSAHPCLQCPTGTPWLWGQQPALSHCCCMHPHQALLKIPGSDTEPRTIPNCSHPRKQEEPGKEAGVEAGLG